MCKISIIVPVYKVEKYLRRSMDSLVNQTLDGVEIICIHDGSPDNCLSILREYEEKYKDKNIVIIDKKNEGVWKGRFDGIKVAKGEYIARMDADDISYPQRFEKQVKFLDKHEDVGVVGSWFKAFGSRNFIEKMYENDRINKKAINSQKKVVMTEKKVH